MPLNAAEEENIEALKRWWDENGKFLLAGLLLLVAGFAGWAFYGQSQQSAAAEASELYQEIFSLSAADPDEPIPAAAADAVFARTERLQSEHGDTKYARYAALFAAQHAVARDDLPAAAAYLRWVLDQEEGGLFSQGDGGLRLTAQLRLGRVLLAQGELQQALSLVNSVAPETFEPGFAELRGDIYQAMGRPVDAREAYVAARQAGSDSELLLMKIENLASMPVPAPASAPAPTVAPSPAAAEPAPADPAPAPSP